MASADLFVSNAFTPRMEHSHSRWCKKFATLLLRNKDAVFVLVIVVFFFVPCFSVERTEAISPLEFHNKNNAQLILLIIKCDQKTVKQPSDQKTNNPSPSAINSLDHKTAQRSKNERPEPQRCTKFETK